MSATEDPGVAGLCCCRRLSEYSSRHVAEELCLVDSELLRKIDPNELQNGAWMKKEKKFSLAPNIMAMVSSFNQLALLIPSEILEEKAPQARAKVISTFIKIAHKCHAFGNYNSLKAVLAGLQCTPIFRLKKTWKEVPSKKRKRFQYLCDRMSEDNNWKLYRDEIDNRLKTQAPLIPFLGVFLTTVALSQEAEGLARAASSRERLDSQKRRRDSLYENYVILEAITVRKRLQKLRSLKSSDDPNECHIRPAILPESDSELNDLDSTISPSHTPLPDPSDNDVISNLFQTTPSHTGEQTDGGPSSSRSPYRSKEASANRSMSIATPEDITLLFTDNEVRNGDSSFGDHSAAVGSHDVGDTVNRKRNRIFSSPARVAGDSDALDSDARNKTRLRRQKNGFDENGDTHQSRRARHEYCDDLSAILQSNASPKHLTSDELRSTDERSLDKDIKSSTSKEKTKKKKRMTLYNLRFRKKKAEEDVCHAPSPEENMRRESVLSGSLECLVDAVTKEDTPPICSDVTRSMSMFNLSGELDDGEVYYLSDTSVGKTSEKSMQSEYHTSNESLQRLKSEEAAVVLRNKRGSLQGLPGHQELSQIREQLSEENKKIEHRHSLKAVDEDKPRQRKSHHVRNKSDTSMLPTYQHMYMYTYASNSSNSSKSQASSSSSSSSSQNRFQSFGEHIKNTASNVFKRERTSKPVIPVHDIPSDPIDLLVQYQFLSLRCCCGVQGHPDIRELIQAGRHNTEGQNYKLSFEREPN